MSKVVKFGGSSLADAKQFRKVADIIHADPERKYVVPSAPGKRFKEDTKVTDMLYRCYDEVAVQGKDFTEAFAPIRERYNGIISDLGLTLNLDEEFAKIGENFKAAVGSGKPRRVPQRYRPRELPRFRVHRRRTRYLLRQQGQFRR